MHSAAWWPTLFVVVIATVTDLRSRRIPNWLVLPFLVAGFVVSGLQHGLSGLLHSTAGLVVGAALFGVLCLMGGMGMGDVKLCGAIGSWVGPSQMLVALVMTGIAGGIIAVGLAVVGGFAAEMLQGTGDLIFGLRKRGLTPHPELVLNNPLTRKMPYAPAIAIGTLISFFAR
ncbi:A24 family peptidase [Terriglobus albidus]|uniref:A24 family peptidase n=1 Tax=Terriglobus albidus TaxID=1592106 RepID=UPI0021E07994|nr:A24 family peptidase [Terriglobus albidus]